ncbi:hypothetical protein M426DRAFT_117003 [Hypoxylon sp. CI-4A]|nr:hypothetical protein M426DRAFT_117003 [Hypoxylon sp. CI-4A]
MAQLDKIPLELTFQIVHQLPIDGVRSLLLVNRELHWKLFDYATDRIYETITTTAEPSGVLFRLFLHIVKYDSSNLVQWLLSHNDELDLNGFTPRSTRITYLQDAILNDAPKVVAHLAKHGTSVNSSMGNYPDLTSLYMTLAQSRICNPQVLNNALRIACIYGFPRTVRFLLIAGADPNVLSPLGYSALHCAIARRTPWPYYQIFFRDEFRLDSVNEIWETAIENTVRALLHFNADINLQTVSSRAHNCGYNCWQSLDCHSPEQTPLHLAAGGGFYQTASLLLESGANATLPNGDGFYPLYTAISQNNLSIADLFMDRSPDNLNPIVHERHRTTALHAACRFAMSEFVLRILKLGVDANVPDSRGIMPLHEVLGQERLDLDNEVVKTLCHLAEFGADPDKDLGAAVGQPRNLGETHPSPTVRSMFLIRKSRKIDSGRARRIENITTQAAISTPFRQKTAEALLTDHIRGPQLIYDTSLKYDTSNCRPINLHKPGKSESELLGENLLPSFKSKESDSVSPNSKPAEPTQDSHNVEEFPRLDSSKEISTISGLANESNAQFWKGLQKQDAPKNQAQGDSSSTRGGQASKRASGKSRKGKKKWAPLKL